MASNDPNGMERLPGETDEEYIARQTRLRAEAKARMQAKIGSDSTTGGAGSTSTPNNNPNSSGNGGYGLGDMDSVVNSVSGAFSSGLSMVTSAVPTDDEISEAVSSRLSMVSSAVNEAVNDVVNDPTVSELTSKATSVGGSLASTATSYGGSFWNSLVSTVDELAATVDEVASSVTPQNPDESLAAALQRNIKSQEQPATINKTTSAVEEPSSVGTPSESGGDGGNLEEVPLEEAPGLPGEDRDGVERLTGETDEQYALRQKRILDQAALSPGSTTTTPPVSLPPSGDANVADDTITEPTVIRL